MGTSKFGGKYGSICGQIWVPDHDSQFAPLRTEIPLLETVGGCPNPVLSKDLNNPSQSKTKIRNSTKKRPLRVKPTGKIVHTVFHVLLYLTCLFPHLRWLWPGGQACDHASEAGDELRLHIYVGPQRQVLPHMAPASAAQPPFLGAMVLGKWTWGDFPTIIGGYGDNDEQIELNTMG